MTESSLRAAFPNISQECLASTLAEHAASKVTVGDSVRRFAALEALPENQVPPIPDNGAINDAIFGACSTITITISGQVRGGKNNMIVLRSGVHIPKKEWAKWRDEKVREVAGQLPSRWSPIEVPVDMHLHYIAGDKRRRDNPAIVDAIFHVLEKAGVVTDDTLLWPTVSSRAYDKASPRADITLSWAPVKP